MARMVDCAKLKKRLPGLEYAPIKGAMGERLYHEVSEEAWKLWLKHSTMVINEYRLNPSEDRSEKILLEQMNKFFFLDEELDKPPEFVAPTE